MTSTTEMNIKNYESQEPRKKTLLRFLLGKPEEQSKLFREIINNELLKRQAFMKDANPLFAQYDAELSEMIYNSKLKEVGRQTKVLMDQIKAHANNEKYPSVVSIIERKLFIVELQIDIGIHNLLQNKNVKFYFEV